MSDEKILVEVMAASIGGSFSASVLYPLEVLKTKMQAEAKANKSSSSGKNDDSDEKSGKGSGRETEDDSESDDVSVIQIQDDSDEGSDVATGQKRQPPTSAIAYAKDLYQRQGIAPFYAGIETSAFQSATEKALYFFAYTGFKNVYTFLSGNKKMGAAVNLLVGCMAEWAHLPITLPLDCWTTQIQTGDNGNKTPLAILVTMLSEGDGIRGMYKGIQAYTILCLKPAIQYTVFEQVKRIMMLKKSSKRGHDANTLTSLEAFLLGMVARTVATIVTFPYLRAKVVLQSQKSSNAHGDDENSKPSIPSMIAKMYMTGGVEKCFQGIGPELTRGVFSAALMMMVKEKISYVVRKALKDI